MMNLIEIEDERCDGCGLCVAACPHQMFFLRDGKASVQGNPEDCPGCPICVDACVPDAIVMLQT